jgi:hypothetical protein
MRLSVIQTENLLNDPAALGCFLSVNGSLVDIITPLNVQNPENNSEVPSSGVIEFVIKDMRKDLVLGTFTGEIATLSSEQWIELSSSLNPMPRIQISVGSSYSKYLNQSNSHNTSDLLNQIRELSTTVLELECKLGKEKEDNSKELNQKTRLLHELQVGSELTLEQLKIKLSNSFRIIQELNKQKVELMRLCQTEQKKVEMLDFKLAETLKQQEVVLEGVKRKALECFEENAALKRELAGVNQKVNQLNFEISLKDVRIKEITSRFDCSKGFEAAEYETRIKILNEGLAEAQKQNKILIELTDSSEKQEIFCEKCEVKSLEIEKIQKKLFELKSQLSTFKAQNGFIQYLQEHSFMQDSEISRLQEEMVEKNCETLKILEKLESSELKSEHLSFENKEIVAECSELKQRVLTLTRTIEVLEREFTNLKCKNITTRKLEKIKLDEIDFQLEQYLFEQGIENLFVKMAHGVYIYGTKRVNISLKKDNRLICRTGGGYTPIDQFLKLYQNTEVEEISRYVKKQSLFLSQGSSPIRTHKRAASITPENHSSKGSPKENKTGSNLEKKILDKLTVVYPLKDRNYTPVSRISKLF